MCKCCSPALFAQTVMSQGLTPPPLPAVQPCNRSESEKPEEEEKAAVEEQRQKQDVQDVKRVSGSQ